jgi:hypothetical protein
MQPTLPSLAEMQLVNRHVRCQSLVGLTVLYGFRLPGNLLLGLLRRVCEKIFED